MSTLIGWVFIYSLLVIISWYAYELLANRRHWHSNDLYQMILHMLQDRELADRVWNHPVIRALTPPSRDGRYYGPTQIPPELFAVALFDSLPRPSPAGGQGTGTGPRERVAALSNPASRDILNLFLERAQGSMHAAETGVADWFELTTRSLALWQARRLLQFISALIIIATVILAGDALAVWLRLPLAFADIPALIGTAFQQSVSLLVAAVAAIGAPLWGSLIGQAINLILRRRSPPPPLQRIALEGQLTIDQTGARQNSGDAGRPAA